MAVVNDPKIIAAFDAAAEKADKYEASIAARAKIGQLPLAEAQTRARAYEKSVGGNPLMQQMGAVGLIEDIANLGLPFGNILGETYGDFKPFGALHAAATRVNPKLTQYLNDISEFKAETYPIRSGAAVTNPEALRNDLAAAPRFGDSFALINQKSRRRSQAVNAISEIDGKPKPFPDLGGLENYQKDNTKALVEKYRNPPPAKPPAKVTYLGTENEKK